MFKWKRKCDIIREYDISSSLLDKWIKQSQTTGSFKASSADTRTKVNVIKANAHKYSVSAMYAVLKIPRATYYYESKDKPGESALINSIKEIFRSSRNNYGTRKIRKELAKEGKIVSRRRIGRIMKQKALVSNYTAAQINLMLKNC